MENFIKKGFNCVDGFLTPTEVNEVKIEIQKLAKSPQILSYSDRNGYLRRMEKFVFASTLFSKLNDRIQEFMLAELKQKYILFKDKVNFKPPGGEGFYAHYDGVFQFQTPSGEKRNGWYEYSDHFINVLIALDPFTVENGALEVAPLHDLTFDILLKNTKQDGSPDLLPSVESKSKFEYILVEPGDICLFDNKCPHRSGVNNSQSDRGSLYLTYTPATHGNFYNQYYNDKESSKNINKSLTGATI